MQAAQDELKKLIGKRGSIKARITIICNHVADLDRTRLTSVKLSELKSRGIKLEEAYQALIDIQDEIGALFSIVPAEQLKERETSDNLFFAISSDIDMLINGPPVPRGNGGPSGSGSASRSQSVEPNSNGAGVHQLVRLPKIDLPKFHGSYDNWLEFRDTYESLVHSRDSIGNMAKFHYLRDSLRGEAKLVFSAIEFSALNYNAAWDILCSRYNNSGILIQNHLKALFSFKNLHVESAISLRLMRDNLSKHLCALTSLGEKTEYWDTLLIFILSSKLDQTTARDWEEAQTSGRMPTLVEFKKFLKSKADQLEAIEMKRNSIIGDKRVALAPLAKPYQQRKHGTHTTHALATTTPRCLLCNGQHLLVTCSDFLKLSTHGRYDKTKSLQCCLNCLKSGHRVKNCTSSRCRECDRKHHTLLHHRSSAVSNNVNIQSVPEQVDSNRESVVVANSSIENSCNQILLATALVAVRDAQDALVIARALLDSASQSSFITENLAIRLGVQRHAVEITVVGITQCTSKIESKCSIQVHSRWNDFSFEHTVLIVPRITTQLPSIMVNRNSLQIPSYIRFADGSFNVPGKIDMLIGADRFWTLLSVGQHSLGPGLPLMQKTKFGWIVSGAMPMQTHVVSCNFVQNHSLEKEIAKFWEIEECSVCKLLSKEERECEQHFAATTRRDSTGRFIVNIPTRNIHALGDSFENASRRFKSLERRLDKNLALKTLYTNFIHEYIALGHMRKITTKQQIDIRPNFYLPHHPVFNEASTSTKLRVVFDGSAKSATGTSLNDCQLVGPTIQDDPFSILLRFRRFAYVVTADICKMYRQVKIVAERWPLQRILWRDKLNEQIKHFELMTVTYGTTTVSFLAIRALNEVANLIENVHPLIAHHIRKGFYVDDLNTGSDSINELTLICKQMQSVLNEYGFELRKWLSNESCIVKQFIDSSTDSSSSAYLFDIDAQSKTLGLFWSPCTDTLSYKIYDFPRDGSISKRRVLSLISQIFDPLGLLAPCTIVAKIFMQRLWAEKVTWDESLSLLLHSEWLKFCSSLTFLSNLDIPRYCLQPYYRSVEIHGFCEASERAYGACLYLVATLDSGNVSSHLLCSKTNVAPLKQLSIPKLELCAAQLLVKLVVRVTQVIGLDFRNCTLWSDSTIVLAWLKQEPNRLKTFVANRVANIQIHSEVWSWRHVPTAENSADMLSRGIDAQTIIGNDLWWHGPQWLVQSEVPWPLDPGVLPNNTTEVGATNY